MTTLLGSANQNGRLESNREGHEFYSCLQILLKDSALASEERIPKRRSPAAKAVIRLMSLRHD